MTNDLAPIQTKELITESDVQVLMQSKFKGFSKAEVEYARTVSAHTQLNPILNQIHFVKRYGKDGNATVTAQVGIDGFRLTADRTGNYAGNDDVIFEYDPSDIKKEKPRKATITVYKIIKGIRCGFTASVRWDEYLPEKETARKFWIKMPHVMLGKCCEAVALRKAFPIELSALRTDEEMDQTDEAPSKAESLNNRVVQVESEVVEIKPEVKKEEAKAELISDAQAKRLYAIQSEYFLPTELIKDIIKSFGFKSSKEIVKDSYDAIVKIIETKGKEKKKADEAALAKLKADKEKEEIKNKKPGFTLPPDHKPEVNNLYTTDDIAF